MRAAGGSLGLTGRYHLQANAARHGLELWAGQAGIKLRVVDDRGDLDLTERAYRRLLDEDVEVLVGPYGSDVVRRAAAVVCGGGRLLWNHGGSADDLARPLLVTLPAPASTYFQGCLEVARERGLPRVVVARGQGRFARLVAEGASGRAVALGMETETVSLDRLPDTEVVGSALLVVGRFDDDVAEVRRLRTSGAQLGLLACVAAGLPAFRRHLGSLAEGVFAPVQWFPDETKPEVGPTGAEFARAYRRRTGRAPDYLAAQAAAAGYLAEAAAGWGPRTNQIRAWRTSTMLGPFALDRDWRQVGHSCRTITWREGAQVVVR